MELQYWVGDFFIDLSRNQITYNKQSQNRQSQIMAPKALAVLTYLAEHQGRVVSQDELLTKIWQDTVVTPNTLQKSIAQLRKALGDDGKGQAYIKTHAKRGYSLECDVRWVTIDSVSPNSSQANTLDDTYVSEDCFRKTDPRETYIGETGIREKSSATDTATKSLFSRQGFRLDSIIAAIVIAGIIGYQLLVTEQTASLTFDTLRSLTATDDKEFYATYTPDGEYIVFHRYLDNRCGNKLWAKNLDTQKEIQLTKDWGAYGSHSFSKDGKTLMFLATEACSEPVTQKNCYNLLSLDFDKALVSPQEPSLILQCRNSVVKKPVWLSNDNIALLQNIENRWKLIDYSISKNRSTDLYDVIDGNLIDFAYSVRDDLIAVTSIHDDGEQYIDMLKPDGGIISSHPIERSQELAKFRPIYPNFDPLNKQLIFSTGKQLFTLSYEGKVAKIGLPFDERMVPTEFHPYDKRLLLIKGVYDSDIALLPRNQVAETNSLTTSWTQTKPREAIHSQLQRVQAHPSFERSNLGEDYAIFQPGGEKVAFWSERSGEEQIWISDDNGPRQLTHFPMDTYIQGIDWAADGKSLLVNANGVLTQTFLDSRQVSFPLEHPVVQLYQWDSNNNSALLLARIKGMLKLVEYNLHTSAINEIANKPVIWALKSEDGRLIYKDRMDRFWQPGPAEAQHIESLDKQGDRSKSFVIKDNVIYAINSNNQLWSYDLNSDLFNILGHISEEVDYLTDINQAQILMKVRVFEKKEVVELSLSE